MLIANASMEEGMGSFYKGDHAVGNILKEWVFFFTKFMLLSTGFRDISLANYSQIILK
jgi:hypothetical protein